MDTRVFKAEAKSAVVNYLGASSTYTTASLPDPIVLDASLATWYGNDGSALRYNRTSGVFVERPFGDIVGAYNWHPSQRSVAAILHWAAAHPPSGYDVGQPCAAGTPVETEANDVT